MLFRSSELTMKSSESTAPAAKNKPGPKNSRPSKPSGRPSKRESKPSTPSGSKIFKESKLERELAEQFRLAGIPYLQEVCAVPGRKFRWDFAFAHKGTLLLLEVQGGLWKRGGHTTGIGVTRDCEKLCLATLEGYPVFQVTAEHIRSGQALRWVQKFLES